MSFQAYLDAVKAKTGHDPAGLKKLMEKAGAYAPDMSATQLCDWLAKEFKLGHGHSMAVWAVFKDKGWAAAPGNAKTKK